MVLPGREPLLSVDVDGSSVTGTGRERGSDLAYRAVLPIKLGNALCAAASMEPSPALEHFATLRQPLALARNTRTFQSTGPTCPGHPPHQVPSPGYQASTTGLPSSPGRLDTSLPHCYPSVLGGRRPSCSAPASAGCGLRTPHLVGNPARAVAPH